MKCEQCTKTIKKSQFKHFCCKTCWENYRYKTDIVFRTKKIERSKAYHLAHKHEPEYKKKHYKCVKKWIENNRKRFNELCRERNRIYQKKLHTYREENDLCRGCGTIQMGGTQFKNCLKCRKKSRKIKAKQAHTRRS